MKQASKRDRIARWPSLTATFLLVAVATVALIADARPAIHSEPSLGTAGPLASASPPQTADLRASASAPEIAVTLPRAVELAEPSVVPSASPAAAALAEELVLAGNDGYRIRIPRLGIDLLIREGDLKRDTVDQHTPENFAFHLPGTSMPGQNGNTYLYAHARRGMFLSLWNARAGDEVFVSAPDGRVLVYIVRNVLPRVAPDDLSVARATAEERLTLQTSTGPNGSDPRFVVLAFPRG